MMRALLFYTEQNNFIVTRDKRLQQMLSLTKLIAFQIWAEDEGKWTKHCAWLLKQWDLRTLLSNVDDWKQYFSQSRLLNLC